MLFTGKTESGFKFKTPKLRLRVVRPITPPGLKLQVPSNLSPELFCKQIGGDCEEIADKFETIDQVFGDTSYQMKERGVPVQQRKYILSKCSQWSLILYLGIRE